jgi:protein tyrosine/serine phosphatase
MRRIYFFLVFLFFLTPHLAVRAQEAAPKSSISSNYGQKIVVPGIHNAGKVSDNVFRGAQPNLSSFSLLKQLGVTTIVNLRSESAAKVDKERREAQALGLRYVYIPVGGFSNPTNEQLASFFTLLRETPAPTIFVHCEFGRDRTGVFIASYRIAFQNWTADQALSEMLAFGFHRNFHPGMTTFIRDLPSRVHSDPLLKSALGAPGLQLSNK